MGSEKAGRVPVPEMQESQMERAHIAQAPAAGTEEGALMSEHATAGPDQGRRSFDARLRDRAQEYPAIRAFVESHRKALTDALGIWTDDDVLVLMLEKAKCYAGPTFPLWKDAIDRDRCDIITSYLRGQIADTDEFRIALSFLLQAFNAAVEALWYHERDRLKPKPHPPHLPPPPRPRRGLDPGTPAQKKGR